MASYSERLRERKTAASRPKKANFRQRQVRSRPHRWGKPDSNFSSPLCARRGRNHPYRLCESGTRLDRKQIQTRIDSIFAQRDHIFRATGPFLETSKLPNPAGDRGFASISLLAGVRPSREFAFLYREAGRFRRSAPAPDRYRVSSILRRKDAFWSLAFAIAGVR